MLRSSNFARRVLTLAVLLLASAVPGQSAPPPPATRVALLLAYPHAGDPVAADIERSFRWSVARYAPGLAVDVVRANSAYEAALACQALMADNSGLQLLAFAGDDGAATATAQRSAEYRMPVLKLSSDPRPFSRLSDHLFEFLPSMEMQSERLAEYAGRELGLTTAVLLVPDDARGRGLGEGFRRGAESQKLEVVAQRSYPPSAMEIRRDVMLVFGDEKRLTRGGARLDGALSPEERAEMFGDAQGGEVLFSTSAGGGETQPAYQEAFFFGAGPDKAEAYSQQLPPLPATTLLLGNSSWIGLDALARQHSVTDGMYASAPLVPRAADSDQYWDDYEQEQNRDASEWERLGLDAGKFVSQIMATEARDRQEVMKRLAGAQFTGRAVTVEFGSGRENRAVRIVRYEGRDLRVVR